MPAVEIVPATPDRVEAVGRMLSRAFDDSPPFRYLYPSAALRARLTRTFFQAGLRDGLPFHEATLALESGNPVGAAVWLPPGGYPLSRLRQIRLIARCAPVSALAWRSLVPSLRFLTTTERVHPHETHWYLMTLGVEPDRQRTGIGSRLLAGVLDRIDRAGLPAYLETDKQENLAYYHRHGFELRDTLRPVPQGPPQWTMWRPPRARAV